MTMWNNDNPKAVLEPTVQVRIVCANTARPEPEPTDEELRHELKRLEARYAEVRKLIEGVYEQQKTEQHLADVALADGWYWEANEHRKVAARLHRDCGELQLEASRLCDKIFDIKGYMPL
jgi:hypothetical protein